MQEDDQTLQGSEGEPNPEKPEVPATQGDDPLDLVTGEDALRAEAKKFRAIAQRKPKVATVAEKKVETPPQVNTGDFVKKSDLERSATSKAKQLVGPEIAAEFDELVKIPLGGYDPLDAESIAANLRERYAILQARKPKGENKDGVAELSSTKITAGTGAGSGKQNQPAKKEPPNFSLPRGPKDWYAKPQ